MRRTLGGLLATLIVLTVGAGTVTATGASGTSLNVCTNVAKDYYGGIEVYANDKGKGASRVLCAPTQDDGSGIGRDGEGSDHRLNKRDRRLPRLEDIWNGFDKNIASFRLRAAAGCVTEVRVDVFEPIGGGEFIVTTLLVRALDNIDGTQPETRLYEVSRSKDDKATALGVTVSCPPELPPEPDTTIGAGDPAVAQSPSASLTALDQRVEVPEAGFAVAFPDDWTVVVDTSEPAEFTEHPVLTATLPDGESCEASLQDGTSWSDLDDWAESALKTFQGFGPEVEATSTGLHLPAGDAIRIDLELPEEGFSAALYLLTDGTAFYGLMCNASDPRADRWLSIAETFEFLSEE
jgi:hypothetical protein